MTIIQDIVVGANLSRDRIYNADVGYSSIYTSPDLRDSQRLLEEVERKQEYLPAGKFFANHQITTDPLGHTATIRHVDFESNGRGGLNFALERIYSTQIAYSQKGEYLVNRALLDFYVLIHGVLSAEDFRGKVENWLFDTYRPFLIQARNIFNSSYGISEENGPRYENALNVEELLQASDLALDYWQDVSGGSYGPVDQAMVLSTEHRLYRVQDMGGDYWTIPKLFEGFAPVAITSQLHLLRERIETFIEQAKSKYQSAIDHIRTLDSETYESPLGDGWTFNVSFLDPPNVPDGTPGVLYLNGHIKERLQIGSATLMPQHKGYFARMSDSTQVAIDNTIISTETTGYSIRYKFQDLERIQYFDEAGRLRIITDYSHNNAIWFEYIAETRRISRITDAAGNTYDFDYAANNHLEKITASYGTIVHYTVLHSNSVPFSYELKNVSYPYVGSTHYDYHTITVFESWANNARVDLRILYSERNPSNGRVGISNHPSDYHHHQSKVGSDSVFSGSGYSFILHDPPEVKAVYRYGQGNVYLVVHPKIFTDSQIPSQVRRTTVSIFHDHAIKYVYRFENARWKLESEHHFEFNWQNQIGTTPANYEARLGVARKIVEYKYYLNSLLKNVTTYTYSTNTFSVGSRVEYEYSDEVIADTYGLPTQICWKTVPGDLAIRTINYVYHSDIPRLWHIQGDTRNISLEYNHPANQDPSNCGKPTIVKERLSGAPYVIETRYWYDRFGNVVKTKNAEETITTYQYSTVNGQPSTFLESVKKIDRLDGSEALYQIQTNSTGKTTSVIDPRNNQTIFQIDALSQRHEKIIYPDGGETRFTYGDRPDNPLQRNETIISQIVQSASPGSPELLYETKLTGTEFGSLNKISNITDNISRDIAYDAKDRVRRIRSDTGAFTKFSYDLFGRLISIRDLRGGTTSFEYDDNKVYRDLDGTYDTCRVVTTKNQVGDSERHYFNIDDQLVGKCKDVQTDFSSVTSQAWWVIRRDNRGRVVDVREPSTLHHKYTYDDLDRLEEHNFYQVNPAVPIRTESYKYNKIHQRKKYTNPRGYTTNYEYDGHDRLSAIMRPLKDLIAFTYDPSSNLATVRHNTRLETYEYDLRNRISEYSDAQQFKTKYEYDLLGRKVAELDHRSKKTSWKYDSRNNITEVIDKQGGQYLFTYNKNDGLRSSQDPRGAISKKFYKTNHAGDIIAVHAANGARKTFWRDKRGRIEHIRLKPLWLTYRFRYNSLDKMRLATMPGGHGYRFKYDAYGKLTGARSPLGKETELKRDGHGNIKEHVNVNANSRWRFYYDGNSNLSAVINPLQAVVEYEYDAVDRITKMSPYGFDPITFDHDPNLRFTKTIFSEGQISQMDFDLRGNPTKITGPEQNILETTYDHLSRVESIEATKGPDSYREKYTYYPNSYVERVQYGDGSSKGFKYDGVGNVVETTDEEGLKTVLKYEDVANLPTKVTFPDGTETVYEYDSIGRTVIINNGELYRFDYNDRRRRITMKLPSGRKITQHFDFDDNLKSTSNHRFADCQLADLLFDIPKTTYTYNSRNQIHTVKDTLDNVTEYRYNALGQYQGMSTNGQSLYPEYSYYIDGNIRQVTSPYGNTDFDYYSNGNLRSIKYDSNRHVSFRYYKDGLIEKIIPSWSPEKTYQYTVLNRIESIESGDQKIVFKRDGRLRVEREIHSPANEEQRISYYKNGAIKQINDVSYTYESGRLAFVQKDLLKLEYQYDSIGRLGRITSNAGFEERFSYDPDGRVTSIDTPDQQYKVTYDYYGNANQLTIPSASNPTSTYQCKYDTEDRLLRYSSNYGEVIDYLYDARGNLSRETYSPTNVAIKRSHDLANNLVSLSNSSGFHVTFDYDSTGNLIGRTHSDGYTRKYDYSYDNALIWVGDEPGLHVEYRYDLVGRLVHIGDHNTDTDCDLDYAGIWTVHGESEIIPDIERNRPLAISKDEEWLIPVWLLGNIVSVYDASGHQITERRRLPYGDQESEALNSIDYGFKGYLSCRDNSLRWAFSRFYDADSKCWLSPDPLMGQLAKPISMNRKRLFSGNPLRFTDSFGLTDEEELHRQHCGDDPYCAVVVGKRDEDASEFIGFGDEAGRDLFESAANPYRQLTEAELELLNELISDLNQVNDLVGRGTDGVFVPESPVESLLGDKSLTPSVDRTSVPVGLAGLPTNPSIEVVDDPNKNEFAVDPFVDVFLFPFRRVYGDPIGSLGKALLEGQALLEDREQSLDDLIAFGAAAIGTISGSLKYAKLPFAFRFSAAWNYSALGAWARAIWQPRYPLLLDLRATLGNLRNYTSVFGAAGGFGLWLRASGNQAVRLAMGPKAYQGLRAVGPYAVGAGAAVSVLGSGLLVERTIDAARHGEKPPIDLAGDYWTLFFYEGIYEKNWQLGWRTD